MANWGNALMALLVDDRFNAGLPANLTPEPGVNSGFKGMQLSVTSLACAIRQMAGPSSIHSLPTEQYNQDVVSLGMHAAVTAMDALECLRNETAMLLLAAAQAVDLRGGPAKLGRGSRRVYDSVRRLALFQERTAPWKTKWRLSPHESARAPSNGTMKSNVTALSICALTLAVAVLVSAQPQRQLPTPAQDIRGQFASLNKRLLDMANDFPEDKYGYLPTPEVRTFGEVLIHVTSGNAFAARQAKATAVNWKDWSDLDPKNYKGKAEIVAALEKSISRRQCRPESHAR